MEPKHKEILITNRPDLVENLNMSDGLFTQLMARKILNLRMVRRIQMQRTPEQQAEELLNILPTRGPKAFEEFCGALKDDFQEEIVNSHLKSSKEEKPCVKESSSFGTQPEESQPVRETVPPTATRELPPLRPGSTRVEQQYSAICYKEGSSSGLQGSRSHDERDFVHPIREGMSFGRGVYQVIDEGAKSGYRDKSRPHEEAQEFYCANKELRHLSKHYVTNNPMNRDLPELLPWEKAREQELPYRYPFFDKNATFTTAYVSGEPRGFTSREPYSSLKRNDSIDAMNKRPLYHCEDNEDMRAKRIRNENTVMLPVIETQPQDAPVLYVGDSMGYSQSGLFTPEPKIYLVDPRQDRSPSQNSPLPAPGEYDDPDIDLTDGPVNVHVNLCSRKFYLDNFRKSYAMRRMPRGRALIMNVNEVEGKPPRRGTNIDRDNLFNLLTQLHMDVKVYNDNDGLSAKEIAGKLQMFAQLPGHQEGDCCVVCLLSHGEEGYLFGTDGKKLQLDNIFALFDNSNCKNLIAKPKIFIIQACRGGALDSGVNFPPSDETDGGTASVRQLPTQSDMLICYPTQAGYFAWRNRERGSWYIEALVQIFMKYAKNEDVCTMLNRVNQLVSRKISRCPQIEMDQMSQMSEYKSTLRKPHLYFFPGIGSV